MVIRPHDRRRPAPARPLDDRDGLALPAEDPTWRNRGVARGAGAFQRLQRALRRGRLPSGGRARRGGRSWAGRLRWREGAAGTGGPRAGLQRLHRFRALGRRPRKGAGGAARPDHDRPGMGKAAADLSDFFIITTDDPLREDPAEIARDVQSGVIGKAPGKDYEIVLDRRAAIKRAIEVARSGDSVLLASKGHERTMQMAAGAEPWDERAEAEAAIREKDRES